MTSTSNGSGADGATESTGSAAATWHVGMVHGALAIPDRTEHDEVVVTKEEIAATGLDYLALGHWHSSQKGKAGATTYAYSGAPEPVAVDQDGAGNVLLVTIEEAAGKRSVKVEERRVGKTTFERLDVDATRLKGQADLIAKLSAKANPDLVLEVRLTGVRPDELDIHTTEVEDQLKASFLRLRVRDESMPALSEGAIPSADTIAGAFIRDIEARIAELEADPERRQHDSRRPSFATCSGSAGCCWRATRSACEDHEAHGPRLPAVPRVRGAARPGADDRPRPERGRQDHDPACARARPDPQGDRRWRGDRRDALVGRARGGATGHRGSSSRSTTTTTAPARSRVPS